MSKILSILLFTLVLSADTKTLDLEYFTLETPKHWKYIKQQGDDSFVGQITIGKGDTLEFDYGYYSNPLDDLRQEHTYSYDTIAGFPAKICTPKVTGKGLTGVYFANTSKKHSGICLNIVGLDLPQKNQKAFLTAIKTIKFKE